MGDPLRKVTKSQTPFPKDDALVKMLYMGTREETRKWTVRIHHWGEILTLLEIYGEDRTRQSLQYLRF